MKVEYEPVIFIFWLIDSECYFFVLVEDSDITFLVPGGVEGEGAGSYVIEKVPRSCYLYVYLGGRTISFTSLAHPFYELGTICGLITNEGGC